MVGNPRVRSAYAPQPWSRRLLSLFLALALALTLTPLPAWGDETGDAPAEASAAKAIAEDSAAGLAESTATDEAPTFSENTDASETTASSEVTTVASKARTALTSSSFAMISRSERPWKTSALPGFLQRNETLYAVAWSAKDKRVDAEFGWTYQWLVGPSASSNDFAPIEGETKSSLELTDELRTRFNGKYLRVRISCGDISVEGPKSGRNYTTLSACGPIKPPVPKKTALDEKSYALLQSSSNSASTSSNIIEAKSLKVGTTLWANVFDGQADPAARIPSQDRWSYQWLAADSREAADEEFAAIEGETCPSLTITKELATKLAGKYIRVRVEGDGQTLYGPSGSFDTPASIGYNTPGPVIAPDQIKLDYILLSWNGEGFGSSELESVPSCNVEDVLEARAYDFDDPHTLYGASDVDFSWQVSDSQDGPFKEITQGASFKVPKDCTGCYLKVVAKAKNGVPGSSTCETKPGKVLPKGVTTLYWVSILNASSSKEIGGTLQAQAYKSTHWGDAPINTNVEYTWRWSAEKPKSSDFDDNSWHIIEGETGSTFTVPESLEGCWVSVAACTGDNTVVSANASAAGPFRKPGTHELYYAALDQMPADSNFTFWSGRTIGVAARNTTNAGTAGSYLSPDELTYTWYSADSWDGEYVELADENVHKPSFVIPDSYVGKHLKCLVSAGFNTMEAGPMRKPIAQGEAIEPADPVPPEPAKPVSATISARVTGLLPHATGEPLQAVNWVSPQKYAVKDSAKTSAWDVFADLLDKAGYFYSLDGGCPYSITTPDRSQTLAMSAGAPWSYWAFLINGEYADVMASSYHPQDGDVLELVYVDATGPATTPDIVVNPDEPGAEWEADWGSFGAAAGEPAVVGSTLGSLPARWTYDFAQGDYASWSEPVVAGGYVFFATGSRLLKLDASTGAVVEVVPLADGTAYGCRPVYTKGLIVVPLNNGRLQALSALTLQTRWLTEALPAAVQEVASGSGGGAAAVAYDQQGLSTLTVSGDYLYAFTAAADWSQTYEGWALCVNASTGAIRWMQKNTDAGYYWSGAASVGDYLVVAGDDGVLRAVSAASTDGEPAATLALGAPVRSTVVTVDGFAYVVTTNGTLHKVSVGANGALTQVGAVSFGDYSTSTPALADGVLYVGGSQNGQGLLAAIDAATLALTATVTAADGSPLPGEVKSTPLLVRDSAGVVALFTCNGAGGSWPDYTSGGGVFAYRLGDQEAQLVFDPPAGMHNYAMASVAYGGAGTFYYVNDSGHLFALGLSSQPPAPRPSTDSETPGEPQNPETPQKPESPTGPGKSNPKNPTSQNAGTTSLGTSANGKTPMAGAGSGAPLNAGAAARTPFDTTVLQGSSNTRAAAAGTDADAGGVAPDRIAEAVADNPTPLAKASGANIDRVSSVASNSSLAEGAATENGNQTAAVALALLSVAGLLGAAHLVRGPRRHIDKETGSHDA